jgi:hypothetical protein
MCVFVENIAVAFKEENLFWGDRKRKWATGPTTMAAMPLDIFLSRRHKKDWKAKIP